MGVKNPLISFGIIALNAQPFLEYNLAALYPFAHQLLVVEGATQAARSLATKDGRSIDGTLDMLQRFKQLADPQKKLQIITARDEGYQDGFWPEKDHMSRAYATRATGDWLWQIDSDEFYKKDDIEAITSLLEKDPSITAISFPYHEFFGGFDYIITGKWHLVEYPRVDRLFRWRQGYRYVSHRPTTIVDEQGKNLRSKKWISQPQNGPAPIFMFHYSYVLPKQAMQKVGYYTNVNWTEAFQKNEQWYYDSYLGLKTPYFLGERGGVIFQWLERFNGEHPEAIEQLIENLRRGKVQEPLRPKEDLEALLNSPIYWLLTRVIRFLMPPYWKARRWLKSLSGKQIRPVS